MGAAMTAGEFFCANKDCTEITNRASLNDMRPPRRCVLVLILIALALANSLHALASDTQWKTLMQVPAEVKALRKSCQEDLASGATSRMLSGMNRYNQGLAGIILAMGRQYYAPALEKKTVDGFVESLNVQADFKSQLSNPTGEFLGTIALIDNFAHPRSPFRHWADCLARPVPRRRAVW